MNSIPPHLGASAKVFARRRAKRRGATAIVEALERRVLLSATVVPITITTVDPTDGLRLSVGDEKPSNALGDSAVTNSFASWVIAGASTSTKATTINATGQTVGTPVTLAVSGLAAETTPLEYAYYDYVQVRLQVPANFNSDITFFYGTSTTVPTSQTGISPTRSFTIPAAQVATDGQFHVYRINVGKLVWWEGNLTNLEVSIPTTVAGQTESISYAEVGDLPNTTLPISPTTPAYLDYVNTAVTPTDGTIGSVQSKHFIYYYDTAVNPGGYNQAIAAHNTLEQLEQAQRIYTQVLGFKDVFGWAQGQARDATRYKLNVTSWYPGYFSGGYFLNVDTTGAENTTTDGFTVTEAPGSPIPHEFGHVTDSQNGNFLAGGHFESHANWYREQWVDWYSSMFASEGLPTSTYDPIANIYSNLHVDNSRLIYNDWRVYTPLQYYAASMGLDPNLVSELWYLGGTNLTIFQKLANLLPTGFNIKNVAAQLMSYWPTLDFPVRTDMEGPAFAPIDGQSTAEAMADFFYQTTTYLIPDADDTSYSVPLEKAPESYAYNTHVLTPTPGSTSMTVTVTGLPSTDSGADWRFVLEDVSNYGTANPTVNTYSPVYANGTTQTINLLSSNDVVLLVVVATPANDVLDLTSFDNTARDTQAPTRLTYPYKVAVSGGKPATGTAVQIAYPRSASGGFHLNPDGTTGGWVDSTASVASTVYVAPGAEVLGHAVLTGTVRILDYAVVADTAHISGSAIVSGYAVVFGSATVSGNARIEDHAMVGSGATIQSNAVVEQYALVPAYVGNRVTVTDQAVVRGEATPTGGTLSGSAIVDFDYTSDFNLSTGVNDNNHPYDEPWDFYDADTQATPPGLIASYSINETSGIQLNDEFGTLNALLVGSPARVFDSTLNNQVLSLNGTNQYANLSRATGDMLDGTFSMWLDPTSGTANQALLYYGGSATTFLRLVGRDANGFAHLTMSINGSVTELVSTSQVPLNAWTNLALTFSNGTATFYINGAAAGSAAMGHKPMEVLGSDDLTAAQGFYLGRDDAGNYFTGKLSDIRFYNIALTTAQIQNEIQRSGAQIGQMFATAPVTFNGTTTEFESGVHDSSVQTIQVWVNPAAASATYTAIIDAYDERGNGNTRGNGIGLINNVINVRLNGVGLWSTGQSLTLNKWTLITLTMNGNTASLYINGVLKTSHTYTAGLPPKNFHVGFYQTDDNTPPTVTGLFTGQLYDLNIFNKVVAPTGVGLPPPTAVNDTVIVAGAVPTSLNVLANDTDASPIVTLTVSAVTQGAHGTVTIPTGGATVIYTPSAGFVGTDSFTYTASDGFGNTSSATVNVTVNLGLTTILISPTSSALNDGQTQLFTAAAYDQSGTLLATQPTFTWTVATGAGTITPSGGTNASATFTAGQTTGSPTIQAASGVVTKTVTVIVTNLAPTVATAAAANPNPATGTTTTLSALGADGGGEPNLLYTWSTTGTPPAPVTFAATNGTNAGKSLLATFTKAGAYNFLVTIKDAGNLTVTSPVTVVVNQTLASVSIAPSTFTLTNGGTKVFTATGLDQFGTAMATQPSFTWSIASGVGGTLTPVGGANPTATFTAGQNTEIVTIKALTGAVSATAAITVNSAVAPAITALNAAPNPVTATTTALSVTATDAAGEPSLIYQWSTVGTPPAAVTFSANNTNAAKATTATFTKAGVYTFQIKITDPSGFFTLSTVGVTVSQTPGVITVTTPTSSVLPNATVQLTASAVDQFGAAMSASAFTWTVSSGNGTVSSTGLYTAPTTDTVAVIRAASGAVFGSATVNTIEELVWYKLDATSGTVVADSSTFAKTGAASGTFAFVSGATPGNAVSGNAFSMTGTTAATGGTVTLPSGVLNGVTDFTISAWVKVASLVTWSRIFDFGTGTTDYMFLTPDSGNTGLPYFGITTSGNGGEQFVKSTIAFPVGVWTNIAITLAGTTATMYINGVVAGTNPVATPVTIDPTTLGATKNYIGKSQFGDAPLQGTIDDFRIFGRAISATEILHLAQATVATAAAATPASVTTTTTALSVLGADVTAGESALKYTWTTTGTPPAAVTFSVNGTNAAKSTIATFTKPGNYSFLVTIVNASVNTTAASITSTVNVTVTATFTSVSVTPTPTTAVSAGTRAFTASALDQFGTALVTQPAFTWSMVTGAGTGSVASTGATTATYTAPFASASATVCATSGALSNTAIVAVTNSPPTLATAANAANATPGTVTGLTTTLAALGADSDGGGAANLTYTWSTTGTPPATVSFTANGTNASKSTVATFTSAGTYNLMVTITDLGGLSITSPVQVMVVQTATTLALSPLTTPLADGQTTTFTPTVKDQFNALIAAPALVWSQDSGVGSIASGLYTAPPAGVGSAIIRATSGAASSTATINIILAAIVGNQSNSIIRLQRSATIANQLDVYINSASPSYSADLTQMSSLSVAGADGNTTIILDFSNGNPLPSGTLTLNGAPSTNTAIQILGSPSAFPVTLTAGAFSAASPLTLSTLNLTANAALTLATGGSNTLSLTGLSIDPGSTIDLNDNGLVLQTADPMAAIMLLQSFLFLGRAGGTWNGTGIRSTAAYNQYLAHGADGTAEYTGLAAAWNAVLPMPLATLGNVPLNINSALIKYTYAGDATLDGHLDIDDFLAADTGSLFGSTLYTDGNFDYTAGVDNADLAILETNFSRQAGIQATPVLSAAPSEIPSNDSPLTTESTPTIAQPLATVASAPVVPQPPAPAPAAATSSPTSVLAPPPSTPLTTPIMSAPSAPVASKTTPVTLNHQPILPADSFLLQFNPVPQDNKARDHAWILVRIDHPRPSNIDQSNAHAR